MMLSLEHVVSVSFWKEAFEPVVMAILFGVAGIRRRKNITSMSVLFDIYTAGVLGLFVHIIFCTLNCTDNRPLELAVSALAGLANSTLLDRLYTLASDLCMKLFKALLSK